MSQATILLSQSSVFHLQKLAKDVHHTTGERHRLADENSMLKLLKKAALSNESTVQVDLKNFARDLNDSQLDSFLRRGVMLKKLA